MVNSTQNPPRLPFWGSIRATNTLLAGIFLLLLASWIGGMVSQANQATKEQDDRIKATQDRAAENYKAVLDAQRRSEEADAKWKKLLEGEK